MSHIIAARFTTFDAADTAKQALLQSGFVDDDVSEVFVNPGGATCPVCRGRRRVRRCPGETGWKGRDGRGGSWRDSWTGSGRNRHRRILSFDACADCGGAPWVPM